MGRGRFEAEFGCYTEWLAEACAALQLDPVPAVSRGTGRPALLELVADRLDVTPGHKVIDLGCGLGGPTTWLARTTGAEVVGVDVMLQSVAGLRRLIPGQRAVVASMRALPMPDGAFDRAWSLGVLEMVSDKPTAIGEIWRVLSPGGRFVVYDFVLTGEVPEHIPQADRFSPPEDTLSYLEEAGFVIEEADRLPVLPATPPDWVAARDAVRDEVRRLHGDDARHEIVEKELEMFRRLVTNKVIDEWIFVASKEGT